uniref:Uncharacterized protein n=1 Tax=Octopus bimaculoides TaxID=37653 RepID=A0A0L8HW08_OCTBM
MTILCTVNEIRLLFLRNREISLVGSFRVKFISYRFYQKFRIHKTTNSNRFSDLELK